MSDAGADDYADPASPDFILDQPDYYCTVTPLLALGRRAPFAQR